MKIIEGGVCAPQGFLANGIHCGIRKNKTKRDLALIYSLKKGSAACVYTQNLVKGAPIYVTKKNVADGYAQAIICNSGNANTCNANGQEIAELMCGLVAKELKISAKDVIVASTGVIGQTLSIEPIALGMEELTKGLGIKSQDANLAIMTTDITEKSCAVAFEIAGRVCKIGGIAKGSGMIHPNMATMLVFLTTDVLITPFLLQKALSEDVVDTFNMISVDGDTSTNDMVSIIANGESGNEKIVQEDENYILFKKALNFVTSSLCQKIASDGEGATKLLTCHVYGAAKSEDARKIAKSVITSSLVKTAMFGSDANWGRILCAIGYAGVNIDVSKVNVNLKSQVGEVAVCANGSGLVFDEQLAKKILLEKEIEIIITLMDGAFQATAWGCDLSYDYVKINGDYRT